MNGYYQDILYLKSQQLDGSLFLSERSRAFGGKIERKKEGETGIFTLLAAPAEIVPQQRKFSGLSMGQLD